MSNLHSHLKIFNFLNFLPKCENRVPFGPFRQPTDVLALTTLLYCPPNDRLATPVSYQRSKIKENIR